jgi:hypothetical protein
MSVGKDKQKYYLKGNKKVHESNQFHFGHSKWVIQSGKKA